MGSISDGVRVVCIVARLIHAGCYIHVSWVMCMVVVRRLRVQQGICWALVELSTAEKKEKACIQFEAHMKTLHPVGFTRHPLEKENAEIPKRSRPSS